MPMQDWIQKYPRVHALLQHTEESLDYVVDTASDDREYARYREIIEETYSEDEAVAEGYARVWNTIRDNPGCTLPHVRSYMGHQLGLPTERLMAFLPLLEEVYWLAVQDFLHYVHQQQSSWEQCGRLRAPAMAEWLARTRQALEALGHP